jgi:hypothetical protein
MLSSRFTCQCADQQQLLKLPDLSVQLQLSVWHPTNTSILLPCCRLELQTVAMLLLLLLLSQQPRVQQWPALRLLLASPLLPLLPGWLVLRGWDWAWVVLAVVTH